jgi:hypothetical protein
VAYDLTGATWQQAAFVGLLEEIGLDQPGLLSANCILQTAHWTVHEAYQT